MVLFLVLVLKKRKGGLISLNLILEQINKLMVPVFSQNDKTLDNKQVIISSYSVVLINSDYHINYKVKQLTLHHKWLMTTKFSAHTNRVFIRV